MKDEALAASLFPPAHKRQHSRTISQSHSLSRQQSPALDLTPAATSTGIITVHTTLTAFAEAPRKPKEYINVAQRKEMRKHGALRDSSYWNQLLIAARKSRGPYFCPSTRSYHVDRHSNLYWSGFSEVDPIAAELEQAKEESVEQVIAGEANSGTESKLSTTVENSTTGEDASVSSGIAPVDGPVATASTPSEVKEESSASNIGNPGGMTVTDTGANSATNNNINGSGQGDLISPTLNPALVNRNLARNPLTSPGQPGAVFPNQMVGQGLHLQQAGINPAHNLGQMPQNMMAGGFISPSSLMQPIPQMQQLPGQMNMGMNPAFANMSQLHPQMMQQNHLQQPLQQQQLLQQQMFQQQQQQQQFLQQQQYQQQQQQQQQMFSPPTEFPNPPRPKGRPRQSKNAQVQLGSPTPSHNRTPSVTWADQQQQ
ncbi:hypothetical protein CPC16_007983 [Podila verticillata]|nr:hypothetical protein BGZ59_003600 [Podila verticillata]KAF9385413.1 hypothetical protein CPC16_007983 [Podila verticillata]KFH67970.1 hypothetical protein MVEG_06701 [Podila verticillata NRRL 6337]